ncbi:hypothetical protein AX17_001854, partial [Amanita inopinata Kibby_2008]
MSVSAALKASARSAYRSLYRVASSTFDGDEPVLRAFRLKMRQDAVCDQAIIDLEQYKERERLAREVAEVLRKNIVQGVKVTTDSNSGLATWRLKFKPETEFGYNDTIKRSPTGDVTPRRSINKNEENNAQRIQTPSKSVPIYYSALKRAHKERSIPILREEDLEESFVRGSGPGGQSINKTENNVQLLHKPTSIRVSCQETRSLALNRKLARRLLLEK